MDLKQLIVSFGFLMLLATSAFSDDAIERGKAKSETCGLCHGAKGVSPSPIWPSLAGQHKKYLIQQMKDFKIATPDGKKGRYDASMTPLVQDLSVDDMNDIAAFYASFDLPKGEVKAKFVERGGLLYRGGDIQKGITACAACHGAKGKGLKLAGIPALSGQQPEYLVIQLKAYKDNKRTNGIFNIMIDVASNMTEDDMKNAASFASGVH